MTPLNILITEDNADLREGLKTVLEVEGYSVTAVSCGEDAISSFKNNDFDLTFMDIKLPGIDGIEALTKLIDLSPDAKVVMMTGYQPDQFMTEVQQRLTTSILHKPFHMEEFLQLIKDLT